MGKRGQFSGEQLFVLTLTFLVTFGVIAAYYGLGIIDFSGLAPTSCELDSVFDCDEATVVLSQPENSLLYEATNTLGLTVVMEDITHQSKNCTYNPRVIEPGERFRVNCPVSNISNDRKRIGIEQRFFNPRRGPGFTQEVKGTIITHPQQRLLRLEWTPTQSVQEALQTYYDTENAEKVRVTSNGFLLTLQNGSLVVADENTTETLGNHGFIADIATRGSRAYIASSTGLVRYEASGDSFVQTENTVLSGTPRSLSLQGSKMFYADDTNELFRLRATGTTTVQQTISTTNTLYSQTTRGNTLYATTANGIQTFDVRGNQVSSLGEYTTPLFNPRTDISLHSNYVFAASAGEGIEVYDVSDAANPARVSFYEEDVVPVAIAYDNTTLYIAGEGGVEVVDASNPASLQRTKYFEVTGTCKDITVGPGTIHVAGCGSGFFTLEKP